ncbi:MerR family transcriptional regulator [Niallia sp. Krafla_26]|uniref:MerR family transcriptional regulator n=1 Tax=Niallia sp. Krafla_26 TaxID=3064703 RepID=UPI003D1645BB
MNTKSVAELLGISTRTVQRWVKQLNLDMERNDLGHFIFTEENIEQLKQVKKQLDEGVLLQDISLKQPTRTGIVKIEKSEKNGETEKSAPITTQLEEKIANLEVSLNQKADAVVSYQLIQHRREIEDLKQQMSILTEKIAYLEELHIKEQETASSIEAEQLKEKLAPRRKKSFIRAIFGF